MQISAGTSKLTLTPFPTLPDLPHDFVPIPDVPVLTPQTISNDMGTASSQSLLGWSDTAAFLQSIPAHSEQGACHLEKALQAAQGQCPYHWKWTVEIGALT